MVLKKFSNLEVFLRLCIITLAFLTILYFIDFKFPYDSKLILDWGMHTFSIHSITYIIFSENTIRVVLVFLLSSLFSLSINHFIISGKGNGQGQGKRNLREFLSVLCMFEVGILIRIMLSSVVFLLQSTVISITFMIVYFPISYYVSRIKWNTYHLKSQENTRLMYACLIPLISFILSISSEGNSLEAFLGVYIAVLLILDLIGLSILMILMMIKQDFIYAKQGKRAISNITKSHEVLGEYIRLRNHYNLMVSIGCWLIMITIVIILLIFFQPYKVFTLNIATKSLWGLMYLLLFRLFSRSYEIVYAFGKDIVSKKEKTTDLGGRDRMGLAIKSLVEIIFMMSLIRSSFQLSHVISSLTDLSVNEVFLFVRTVFYDLLGSIATMAFNVSFERNDHYINVITHIIQVMVSLSLISFSIATYISMPMGKKISK